MSRRTRDRIIALRGKITEIWGKIYYNPMSTIEFFEKIDLNYNNLNHRNIVYHDIKNLQKEAEEVFESIMEEDNGKRFKMWMDYCWLHKIPYIILTDGIASTPKDYGDWQRKLSMIGVKKLKGLAKALLRLGKKNMELSYYIQDLDGKELEHQASIQELVSRHKHTLKLLEPPSDDDDDETEPIEGSFPEIDPKYLDLKK